MEYPRGLILILGLLSLGFCTDFANLIEWGPYWGLILVVLIGRVAAIVGILMQSTIGWFLAMIFFVLIAGLNGLAVASDSDVSGFALGSVSKQ